MATTSTGKPYPLGTDHVVDGDDAIKALALAVDAEPGATAYLAANATVAANAPFVLGQTPGSPAWTKELVGGVTLDDALGQFVVPVAGLYQVTFGIKYDNNTSGTNRLGWVESPPGNARILDANALGSVAVAKTVEQTRTVRLAVGGTLRLFTYHDAAGPLNVLGNATRGLATWFEFKLVGA